MKKQADIVKDQYKFSKDQMNVNNNNREDDVVTEDDTETKNGNNKVDDTSGESNITKEFDVRLLNRLVLKALVAILTYIHWQ